MCAHVIVFYMCEYPLLLLVCVCVTGPDTVGARLSVTPAVQSCRDFLGGWAFCPRFYACAV